MFLTQRTPECSAEVINTTYDDLEDVLRGENCRPVSSTVSSMTDSTCTSNSQRNVDANEVRHLDVYKPNVEDISSGEDDLVEWVYLILLFFFQ